MSDTWDTSDFLKRYTSKTNGSLSCTDIFSEKECSNSNGIFRGEMNNGDKFSEKDTSKEESVYDPYTDNVFCTAENLETRLQYLNQELTILGFPAIFDKNENSKHVKDINGNFDVTKLINCTYDLLKRHSRQLRLKDDLEDRQMRTDNDNDVLLQTQDRLKQENENLRRDNALSVYREKEQVKNCTCLQQDLKAEREEKRKMKSEAAHLKKQFYHESKRLEKEISRLKDKVHQLLNDKSNQSQKVAIDILNPLQRSDGKRSKWKVETKKCEEEMYKLIVANYEEREKVLAMENHELRDSLSEIHKGLMTIDPSITTEILAEETKLYQMPFHIVKEDINKKFQYVVSSVKCKLDNGGEKSKPVAPCAPDGKIAAQLSDSNEENKVLTVKLEQATATIAKLEKLMQGLKDGYSEEAFNKILKMFGTRQEEMVSVEERERMLKEERDRYEEDRKQFTNYVLQVAKEKEELERERVQFYMECISSPVVNKEMKISPKKVHGSFKSPGNNKSCPSTPNFCAAPRRSGSKKPKTPSTGELYKYLSLSYDSFSDRKSSGNSHMDGSYRSPQAESPTHPDPSRKVLEHSDKIRKAVAERQSKSTGDDGEGKKRNVLSELANLK